MDYRSKISLAAALSLCCLGAAASGIYNWDFKTSGVGYIILSEDDKTVMTTYETSSYNSYRTDSVEVPATVTDGRYETDNVYTVTVIGENTFRLSTQLEYVKLPSTITSIEEGAFRGCTGLAEIDMPERFDSSATIAGYAFHSCSALTSIAIPENVVSLDKYVFYGCSGLVSLSLPSTLTEVDYFSLYGCEGVTDLTIAADSPYLSSYNGSIHDKDQTTLMYHLHTLTDFTAAPTVTTIARYACRQCDSLTTVELPSSVTTVEGYAFAFCDSLREVTFPAALDTIGTNAFMSCNALATVYSLSATPPSLGKTCFSSTAYSSATLYVPTGCASSYSATGWGSFENIVEMDFGDAGVEETTLSGEEPAIVSECLYTLDGKPATENCGHKAVYIVVRTCDDGTNIIAKEIR